MKSSNGTLLMALFILAVVMSQSSRAQTKAQQPPPTANARATSGAEQKNIQAYIELMRENVRQDKAEIMGAIMVLSAADAAKFWPPGVLRCACSTDKEDHWHLHSGIN